MKLLFLSVPTGHGHHQVAAALESYFKNQDGVECKTLDVFENVNHFLGDSLQRSYLLSTKMVPEVYGTFYDIADRRNSGKYSNLSKIIKTVLNSKLMRFIRDYKPDVIVCTHNFAGIALSYLKTKYPIKAKTIGIVTDFTVHPFWEDTDLDYYITASELLNFQMEHKGFSLDRVKPLGIPIHTKFSEKMSKSEARKHLSLDEKFTVLVMMGSMGYGSDTFKIIKELSNIEDDIQIIVVCGNNKKLKHRVENISSKKKILCYGFSNEVDRFMDAADCIITKPGGLSTSEALAKTLPMIILDSIPGQEDRNREFLLNNGIALSLSDSFSVSEAIYILTRHPYKINLMKENMRPLAKPNSAKDTADFITSLYNK